MTRANLDAFLRSLDPRVLPLVFGALAVGGVLLALQLGLRPAWSEYSALRGRHETVKASFDALDAQAGVTLAELDARVEALRRDLYGDAASVPREELEAFVVNTLDDVSASHGVTLLGIAPDEPERALMFEELPYAVDVRGSYFAIHRWLYEVESALRPMVVKRFELAPDRETEGVVLSLRIVAYRASEDDAA